MTTAEKLAYLNELRLSNGKATLAAWKQAGAKLDEAIVAEQVLFNTPKEKPCEVEMPEELDKALSEGNLVGVEQSEPIPATTAKKGKFETVRAYAEHLLKTEDGLKHAEVAEKVRKKFDGAKTSAASVAWYASKMKKR